MGGRPEVADMGAADRTEFSPGLLGVDEELERVGLLVPLHQAVQGGLAEPRQRAIPG